MNDKDDEYALAKKIVFKKLAGRSQYSGRLKQGLIEAGISLASIERVLSECQQWGYLDDTQWVENQLQEGLRKRDGPQKVLQKLRSKGVEKEAIQPSLSAAFPLEKQQEMIKHLLANRHKHKDLCCHKERQKVIASLLRKGFEWEAIQAVIEPMR